MFHLLKNEHVLQRTVSEGRVELDIFYRDPKKCFNHLRIFLHKWQKNETICQRRYRKKILIQHDKLSLLRRNFDVAYEKKVTKNSKAMSIFISSRNSFVLLHNYQHLVF